MSATSISPRRRPSGSTACALIRRRLPYWRLVANERGRDWDQATTLPGDQQTWFLGSGSPGPSCVNQEEVEVVRLLAVLGVGILLLVLATNGPSAGGPREPIVLRIDEVAGGRVGPAPKNRFSLP